MKVTFSNTFQRVYLLFMLVELNLIFLQLNRGGRIERVEKVSIS